MGLPAGLSYFAEIWGRFVGIYDSRPLQVRFLTKSENFCLTTPRFVVILANDRLSKWHSPGQGGCLDSAENGRTATGGRAQAMRLGVHVHRSVGAK
ncbi:hypothetical protein IMCC26256_112086 [Actinobacteria bacterium IMCC26256]|nr:hypothetical protein IMCC26256_112086 [Actinobacteria bacterium IMCC26256]